MDSDTFPGFSLPEGAWLPSELIAVLPVLNKGQLKVLLALIYRQMQVAGSEPTSLSDLMRITGLARSTVGSAIKILMSAGLINRYPIGSSFSYEPLVQISDSQVKRVKLNKKERKTDSDSLSFSLDSNETLNKLRSCGVYVRTAQELVKRHEAHVIDLHVDYFRYAIERGLARSPGWLVMSITENWAPPLGYDRDSRRRRDPSRYGEWEA